MSPKVAYVIMSRIPTHMQNLVTIPQGVSFPRMREIAHQRCLGPTWLLFIFQSSPGSWTDFHAQYVKRRGSAQGCAFSGLESKNLKFTPVILENPQFLGPLLTGLRKFSAENRFTVGVLPYVNSP